tara:strand:- start:645 stop:887 length:243 start_codon:yes stop_codon:yes gene_type:complete
MVKIIPSSNFKKAVKHLDGFEREKLEKQIRKIIENPDIGKPLKYRRNERCLYVRPFRLIYSKRENELILLKFEHRKNVYE